MEHALCNFHRIICKNPLSRPRARDVVPAEYGPAKCNVAQHVPHHGTNILPIVKFKIVAICSQQLGIKLSIGGDHSQQLATAVRAVTTDSDAFTALCYLGAVLNGAAGVLVMSAPPLVTVLWFEVF